MQSNYEDGELYSYYKWEYDAHGNETRQEHCWVDNGNSIFDHYTYEYDDAGNIVKKTISDDEGNITEMKEYDSNGNVLKWVSYGNSSEYEYNSLNDYILLKAITSDDVESTETYEYVYQFIGNIE